jgi:hypothetical protein
LVLLLLLLLLLLLWRLFVLVPAMLASIDSMLQSACRASRSFRYSLKGLLGKAVESKGHDHSFGAPFDSRNWVMIYLILSDTPAVSPIVPNGVKALYDK